MLPHPPVLRAVQTVVDRVRQAGHTAVAWQPYRHAHATELIERACTADGGLDVLRTLDASGEPLVRNLFIRRGMPQLDVAGCWELNLARWRYQCEHLAAWRAAEEALGRRIDALVAPVTPSACAAHDRYRYFGYTTFVNVLDLTSVVVPVTTADAAVDAPRAAFSPRNDVDAAIQAECKSGPPREADAPADARAGRRRRHPPRRARCRPDHRPPAERGAHPGHCRRDIAAAGRRVWVARGWAHEARGARSPPSARPNRAQAPPFPLCSPPSWRASRRRAPRHAPGARVPRALARPARAQHSTAFQRPLSGP